MVEFNSTDIILVVFGIAIGIPVLIASFTMIRRMTELHKDRKTCEGELLVFDSGEVFSEFHIPIEEMTEKDYILLKVTKVKPKIKEDNNHGNVST